MRGTRRDRGDFPACADALIRSQVRIDRRGFRTPRGRGLKSEARGLRPVPDLAVLGGPSLGVLAPADHAKVQRRHRLRGHFEKRRRAKGLLRRHGRLAAPYSRFAAGLQPRRNGRWATQGSLETKCQKMSAGRTPFLLKSSIAEAVSGTSWLRLVAFLFGNDMKSHGHRQPLDNDPCGPGDGRYRD